MRGGKRQRAYADIVCAFDIETYTLDVGGEPTAIMYMWQFQAGLGATYIGRTWDEYREFINRYTSLIDYDLVIYVQNLHYEFSFLKSQIPIENVFAKDKRHIVRFNSGKCEYRCSYIHSNMSLAEYTSKYKAPHAKLVDTVDYYTERYFDSDLDDSVIEYGAYDVMGLVEAIMIEMQIENDTLYSIPLTSTGYVRREAKDALRHIAKRYREGWKTNYRVYQLERQAFRGGDTHASRYYVGLILNDVNSADLSSDYPFQLTCKDFPVGEWTEASADIRSLLTYAKHHVPFIAVVQFYSLRLIDGRWGFPYIPYDKCRGAVNYELDNGRVLSADFIEITLTDIDLEIILSEYDSEIIGVECYTSKYMPLPPSYAAIIKEHYRLKTSLKGVKGQEVYYAKEKNRINAFFGLTAQNPAKESYTYKDGLISQDDENIETLYEKCKPTMPYAWGVWCTAHARKSLHDGLHLIGNRAVYVDTDSIKYLGDGSALKEYNAAALELAALNGCYAEDKHGNMHYMGVFEDEPPYSKFLTWGAKKYAFEQEGEIGVTIAGVGKKAGGKELAEAGGLEKLRPGFTFVEAGGLEATYNDYMDEREFVRGDGVAIKYSSNLALTPSTYTLGLADNYALLLANYANKNPKNLLFRHCSEG